MKIKASHFVFLATLLNMLLFGYALYDFVASHVDLLTLSGLLIGLTVFAVVFVFNLLFFSLLAVIHPVVLKAFLIVTAPISALALYYLVTYQVILDKTMMGNIFNTRDSEMFDLITPSLFLYVFLLGVVPCWLLLKVRLVPLERGKILRNLAIVFPLFLLFLYLNSSSWLWIDKYSKLLGGKILPWAYIVNTMAYYSEQARSVENQVLLPKGTFANDDKMVVVLIIGETARAHNFSLLGYPRETNPLLKKAGVAVLKNTTSCTTYTTGSLACILSHDVNASNAEPLPSYLQRLGVDVIWRTTNWGEPPIKVGEYQSGGALRGECKGSGCNFDEVLLTNLTQRIQASDKQKVLVVLHTKGSHGPSYYSRYPDEFEKFVPVCRYEEISKCSEQELINAYDNTIVYTDYFLNRAIDQLKALQHVPVLMLYISDHGESLGEGGLYLHGTPYLFAPDYQKKIPFIAWLSDAFSEQKGKEVSDMTGRDDYSQLNVFHTVVGAFDLQTEVYNSRLDLLH